MQVYDAVIVGGGPAGSHLASKLAESSLSVCIIDKKDKVGKKACSGLVSTRIDDFVELDSDLVLNKVNGARFHSPDNLFDLSGDNVRAYVIDRVGFDRNLLDKAIDSGAHFFGNTCYKSHELCSEGVLVSTDNGCFKSRLLVGADGACSMVRKNADLSAGVEMVNGVIGYFPDTSGCDDSDDSVCGDSVELFYGKDTAPGFFAWKIPRKHDVELGLACSGRHLDYFRKFAERMGYDGSSVGLHSHPINFGMIEKSVCKGVVLIGDAACQVKPFSGGGIVYGLICAEILASVLLDRGFSQESLIEYEKLWKRKLKVPIENGLAIRHMLDSLDDDELDEFFRSLSLIKSQLIQDGDMDFL